MINEYWHLASCHKELKMRPLDSLVDAIPEFAALSTEAKSAAE
jgi:hypothetical protein